MVLSIKKCHLAEPRKRNFCYRPSGTSWPPGSSSSYSVGFPESLKDTTVFLSMGAWDTDVYVMLLFLLLSAAIL